MARNQMLNPGSV